MLDAAGGAVLARKATSLGAALSRADVLRSAVATAPSPGQNAWGDAWSGAFFDAADQGLVRRESGRLVLTAAGRAAVSATDTDTEANARTREVLKELVGLSARELRERTTPQ